MDEYDNRPDPRLEVSICGEDGLYDLRIGKDGFKYPGLVLIFNQTKFTQNAEDLEATDDRLEEPGVDLKEIMTELGFKVFYYRNYARVKIMNTIGKYATFKGDKKEYGSFLLFFLSHGNIKIFEHDFHEIVKTADDDMLISDIWKHFESTSTWNNKPKCFFFQTCRGSDLVEGVKVAKVRSKSEGGIIRVQADAGYDQPGSTNDLDHILLRRGNPFDDFYDYDVVAHNSPNRYEYQADAYYASRPTLVYNPSIPFTEPKFSDLLIFHATYPGAASFRETEYSPFINAVITNFRKDLFTTDLFSIVQNIQKEVAYTYHANDRAQRDAADYVSTDIRGSRLMPMIESTLSGKICYQNPNDIQVGSVRGSHELPKQYEVKSGKGKAVIFANKYKMMESLPPKPYVTSDVERLQKSFGTLNCETMTHWDLNKSDFLKALDDLGTQDYSDFDFFCVVFYGYGFKDHLLVRDHKEAHKEEYVEVTDLWQPLLGSRCPTLIDKPKFIIVSAIGIETPGVSGKFRRFVTKDVNIENTRALNEEATCDPGVTPQMYVIPEASDFLLLFHSTSGTAKYMDFMDDCWDDEDEEQTSASSFFLKLNELLQNGRNSVGDWHLLDVIQKFQYNMTKLIKDNVSSTREGQNKREVPLVLSTLTKSFVLKMSHSSK